MAKPKRKVDLNVAEAFVAEGRTYDRSVGTSVNTPEPQVASNPITSNGRGIVERADGTKKRRLVVYVTPENAKILKAVAALEETDMSTIVDDLLDSWRQTQNTL